MAAAGNSNEAEARAAVVAEARSWIGTPYHHCADVKGRRGGVDCAMLIVRVYVDLGFVEPFDPRPYPQDWMMHRDEERYLGFLLARARAVSEPQPGDVILFRVGRCFSHGGIVTSNAPLTLVHAYAPAGVCFEEVIAFNSDLTRRMPTARFASYWAPTT